MHIHKPTRMKIALEKDLTIKVGAVTKTITVVVGARKCTRCGQWLKPFDCKKKGE